ncbi:MAG: excinuclease ABC subunit UvrA [Myxococcota bacterium]|jgi:excinuclease ABC subunit A|nr:excinuclease ABC subunit UvrA [Myxococcota bacterium]
MAEDEILIEGARENNLRGIDVRIPHRRITALTGVSGSGKSSLAFDTLFAEGQRRYVESLSAYARQFLGQLERPRYERIRGLSPTLAVGAGHGSVSPRSTVGTLTEIHDFLRVLYARLGSQFCHRCGREVGRHDPDRIRKETAQLAEGTRFLILAPLVRARVGDQGGLLAEAFRQGFSRIRVDGQQQELTPGLLLSPGQPHDVELVVDRLVVRPGNEARIADSLETGFRAGQGQVIVSIVDGPERRYSKTLRCPWCDVVFPEPSPASFSFNSPQGCCPECRGLGRVLGIDPARVVPDPGRSLRAGALRAPGFRQVGKGGITHDWLANLAAHLRIDLDTPWAALPEEARQVILHGWPATDGSPANAAVPLPEDWEAGPPDGPDGDEQPPTPEAPPAATTAPRARRGAGERTTGRQSARKESAGAGRRPAVVKEIWAGGGAERWEGVCPTLLRRLRETSSEAARQGYQELLVDAPCPACGGSRLRPESRAVRLGGRSLPELQELPATEVLHLLTHLALTPTDATIAAELLTETRARLSFLCDLGLGYLGLGRPGPTLSGGELQRIRLAAQLGGELSGVTYVLDEPSTGLHPVDGDRLIAALTGLRDAGNTVVVVEHDERIIRAADHIIDFGPGAGASGGTIVASGTVDEIAAHPTSLTGAYLARRRTLLDPAPRRRPPQGWLHLTGARGHNLRHLDVSFPLGCLVAVTGVSGAGKSTLVQGTLAPALAARLNRAQATPAPFAALTGSERLDKVVPIDQRPIGRSPRSTAATYTGLFDLLRELFAGTVEARTYGFTASRFSFNSGSGGRCEVCQGEGFRKVEMHFLPDVQVRCEACQGQRFNEATLRVRYQGLNIAEVLSLSCEEAAQRFAAHPALARILTTLREVGLGYLALGQPANTLSGGEAQRVKLARELARPEQGRSLYLLDEPSRGLHPEDLTCLLRVLEHLIARGNSVIVVEHSPELIGRADWVIDLGPGGGEEGGQLVAAGTPEAIAACPASVTGRYLRDRLGPLGE